jgi:DnaK suppressor protein
MQQFIPLTTIKEAPWRWCHDEFIRMRYRKNKMDSNLTASRFGLLRCALLARREVLLSELTLRQGGESRVQHARDVLQQDADDAVAHGADREVDLALTDHERHELAEIGAALQRLASGDYGVCIDCGTDIGFERLQALPQALRCVACESVRESRGGKLHRLTM